jgi:hypothetical protein
MRPMLVAALLAIVCGCAGVSERPAQPREGVVSILIVRHAETNQTLKHLPLSAAGEQRAKVLTQTMRGVRFTHAFATHTVRAKQMLDEIAAKQGLRVVQMPEPGSSFDGQPVTDQTTRRAPIEPMSKALLSLPAGSVAIAALNSENIYAILNRLGVPEVKGCAPGAGCVPCTDNTCYPRDEFNHLWHVVIEPGKPKPLSFVELRYGEGWSAAR